MAEFLLALLVFLLLHSVPAISAIRQRLIGFLGKTAYLTLYSVVSIVALGWVFHSALSVEYVPLWDPNPWQGQVTLAAAPIGVFLVLSGLFSVNPMSVSVRPGTRPGAIVSITRHPVLWGFFVWAAGHLVSNGDLRSLILFGGFALFSLGSMPMVEARARRRMGEGWNTWMKQTSAVPFAANFSGRARLAVDTPMAIAAVVSAVLTWWLLSGGHAVIFGADPLLLALPDA